ncbi:MAG: hypothetical protein LBR75_02855 [Prevotellaceae bacterium]|jgi:hypothetical protein|nr:hypothetical protein [Prevotellaceae bacterium]
MDNLGDILYILVFASIIIFNAVKSLRKAKTATTQMPDILGNPVPDHYDDFEEENSVGEHYQMPKPQPVKVPEFNPIVQTQVASRKAAARPKAVIQPDEIEEFQTLNIDFSDADELRKGIIFAEIFNRKY